MRRSYEFVLDEPDLLVVPDLTADPRTAANPLVTSAPHIRFHADARLRSPEGHVPGSLCVIDLAPRPDGLTTAQADMGLKPIGIIRGRRPPIELALTGALASDLDAIPARGRF